MAMHASILYFKNEFVAELADGRRMAQHDLKDMAQALFRAGVAPEQVDYQWRSGTCMITAGQQVALRAELARLQREVVGLTNAA